MTMKQRHLERSTKLYRTSDALLKAAADQHAQADTIVDPEARKTVRKSATRLMERGHRIERRAVQAKRKSL